MFIDETSFPFVETLTGAWPAMRDEALALPERHFLPWLQREMYDEGWSVVPLCWSGRDIDTMRERCPRTLAALDAVPGLAMAVFSRLGPGTRIAPHVGWGNRVYRLHVGLVVPQGCWLEVAGERRAWREGGCLIFDDTVQYAAANTSSQARLVLMLDFMRPGLHGPAYEPHRLPHELRALVPLLEAGLAPRRPYDDT